MSYFFFRAPKTSFHSRDSTRGEPICRALPPTGPRREDALYGARSPLAQPPGGVRCMGARIGVGAGATRTFGFAGAAISCQS